MDDLVGGHRHHPDAVGVLAELAADGRAHDHVQATVAATGVPVIMAREDRFHPCVTERGERGAEFSATTAKKIKALHDGTQELEFVCLVA